MEKERKWNKTLRSLRKQRKRASAGFVPLRWRALLLFSFILLTTLSASAQQVGESFDKDGLHYVVTSISPMEVRCAGVSDGSVADITVPDKVLRPGDDKTFTVTAFGGGGIWSENGAVKTIHLPNTVTKILGSAFAGNGNLTDFYIPASVDSVNYGLGIEASSFPKFHVDESNTKFSNDEDGALYNKAKTVLFAVPSRVTVSADGTYKVREGVTNINGHVFTGSIQMTTIWFPKTISEINNGYPSFVGFYSNNNVQNVVVEEGNTTYKVENGALVKITPKKDGNELIFYPSHRTGDSFTVPDDVTEITINSIAYNPNLKNVDLNKVVRANGDAINGLQNLTSLGISASMTSLTGFVTACPNIANYNIASGNENFTSIDGVVFTTDKKTLKLFPPARNQETYTIPEGTEKIDAAAFSKSRMKKLVISKSVTSIGDGGISNMDNLTDIEFEAGSQLASLDWQSISSLKSLKTITLPPSVKKINERGLNDCQALEEVNISDNSELTSLAQNAFYNCPNIKRVSFGANSKLDEIGANCFNGFKNLESFTFPASVTKIDANAFFGCSNLKTITFAEGSKLTTLGDGCFSDCAITDLSLPNTITSIGNEAFRNCKALTNVHFPASVTRVDPSAFKGCTNIMNYTVDDANTFYSSTHGMLCDKTKTILRLFPAGHAKEDVVLLPPSITEIGANAFYKCDALTSVVIPQKVTKIDSRAFGYCNNLKFIALLCDSIIPSANIAQGQNDMAFDNGSNGDGVVNMPKQITLYVRSSLYDKYKTADFWKDFGSIHTSFTADHEGSTGKDEFLPISDKGMLLISTTCKDPVYVAPQKLASSEEPDLKRNVSMVDNYAFQNAEGIEEVIFKNNIYSLGALAFYTKNKTEGSSVKPVSTTIKAVVFCGNTAPEVLQSDNFDLIDDFREFEANQKIYVKKSKLVDYQTAMAKFKDQISYKLPGVSISSTYGTFCREFDTDLSDYFTTNKSADVAAFVAGYEHQGTDEDGNTVNLVHMTSIDENGGYTAEGEDTYGYIPANTGVLLKVLNGTTQTPADFYYTIGEHDDNTYTIKDNLMTGVLKPNTRVAASGDSPVYIMSKSTGKLIKVISPIANFPVHRAYMKLPTTSNAKAAVRLVFDDGSTTAINAVPTQQKADNGKWYDLNGVEVSNPQHGVFIHNNEKIIKK